MGSSALNQPEATAGAEATPPLRPLDLATLGFTFFAVGVTVSVALVEHGVPTERALAASVLVFSATAELAYLTVRDSGGGELAAVASGWLVTSRFGLLCASLGAKLRVGRWEKVAAAAMVVDPAVALAVPQPPDRVRATFWPAAIALVTGWLVGSAVGVFVGNVVGDADRWGLDAVFPAALLSIIGAQLRRRDGMTAALIGAGLCLVLLPITPGGVPILASTAGAVAGVFVAKRWRS